MAAALGSAEAAESRGRVSPRLALRVSERRDPVTNNVSSVGPGTPPPSPLPRPEFVEGTGESQRAVSLPNGGEGASGPNWLDRIAVALPWLVIAWIFGVFGLSIRLAIGWRDVHRLRRGVPLPADGAWQALLSRLCDRLHIRSSVKLLESSLVDVPTMIGWLRPVILWPPALLIGLSVEQFEALLAHELAHVRRHDYLVNLVQTAIETLLFYHPAVWWLSRRIRHERECCCDDLAVTACGNRLSYASALATLEELRPPARQLALAADGGRLLTRIRRILGLPNARRRQSLHWLFGLTLSATLLATGIAVGLVNLATGDEPAKKSADPPASNRAGEANPSNLPDELKATSGVTSVLVVQTGGVPDVMYLNEELVDRIKMLPHVKAVRNGGLFRGFSLRTESRRLPIIMIGVPPGGSTLDQELTAGRLLDSTDHKKAVVSKSVAEGLHKSVGDTILPLRTKIVGIVAIKDPHAGNIIELPLSDVQDMFYAPHQVNRFLVGIDVPNDGTSEHKAQLAELNDRIRALDEAIRVLPWPDRQPFPRGLSDAEPVYLRMSDAQRVTARQVIIGGRVIDDTTGKRIMDYHVQSGTVTSTQGREVINWGPTGFRPRANENGRLYISLDWFAGERARIVATGYVPQSVLLLPPDVGGGTILEHVVRLQLGRQISGRVVDCEGKPVVGANVFVVGALADVNITGGKASTRSQRSGWTEDASIIPFKTDAEGKFTVTGLGGDAKYLAVSCPAFDHLVVPAPPVNGLQVDFVIRLPEPGKLVVHFDIAGAGDEADVLLRPAQSVAGTSGPQSEVAQADVVYQRSGRVKRHGEVVFDNLPPGEYAVERMKDFESVYGVVTTARLERSIVKIVSGQSAAVDFARPKGASVSGQVVGLDRAELRKTTPARVFVTVERANETHDNTPNPLLDAVDVGTIFQNGDAPEGKFTTERLPPGQYRITANLFDDSRSDLTTVDKPPLFSGETLVTVSDDTQPPSVKIELQRIEQPVKPSPPPPKPTLDTSPSKESAEKPRTATEAKSAEPAKPAETANPQDRRGRAGFIMAVQKKADTGSDYHLPEGLGERIKKLPHVKSASGWLVDFTPIDPLVNESVMLMGWPPDSIVLENWKFVSGRFPRAEEHHKIVVGKEFATKLSLKAGDTIGLYGNAVEVVGVFESSYPAENDGIYMLLSDLQDITKRPHQVSSFAVAFDIPQDGQPDHKAQTDELRKQIERLAMGSCARRTGAAGTGSRQSPTIGHRREASYRCCNHVAHAPRKLRSSRRLHRPESAGQRGIEQRPPGGTGRSHPEALAREERYGRLDGCRLVRGAQSVGRGHRRPTGQFADFRATEDSFRSNA